jgi:hypothetical protein
MIFIEDRRSKVCWLVFLVVIFSSLVIWQWFSSRPLQTMTSIENQFSLSNLVKDQSQVAWGNIKASLATSQLQLKDLQVEWQRQAKERALIEQTREYLNNSATSTK